MSRHLVQHSLQRRSSRLNEIRIESPDRLLLGRRRDDHTWVIAVQCIIQPKEIAIPTGNRKLRLAVCLRRSLRSASAPPITPPTLKGQHYLCSDLVDDMAARQIPHLVRIPYGDLEHRFRSLFDTDARLRLSLDSLHIGWRLHRWRAPEPGTIFLQDSRVHWSRPAGCLGCR